MHYTFTTVTDSQSRKSQPISKVSHSNQNISDFKIKWLFFLSIAWTDKLCDTFLFLSVPESWFSCIVCVYVYICIYIKYAYIYYSTLFTYFTHSYWNCPRSIYWAQGLPLNRKEERTQWTIEELMLYIFFQR